MPAVFLVSDTHFGHAGVCRFTHPDDDSVKLRPWDDPAERDEEMIRRWNDRVRPNDKVYHLGDVVINRKALSTLARLNGDKVLIRGNHDIFRDDEYRVYFRELRAYHVMNGMILSHIPIHAGSLGRLNGDKVLIRGNHDIFRDDEYRVYFRELRAYHVMNGMILSHIPIHEASLGRFGVNIHGHLHASRVMRNDPFGHRPPMIDPRYWCACVEQTDFAPVLFEDAIKRIEAEGGHIGFKSGNGPAAM